MQSKSVNIVLVGVNYFGVMASSQRVKNIINPLLTKEQISVTAFINNGTKNSGQSDLVQAQYFTYNTHKPFSVLVFILKSVYHVVRLYKKGAINIIYHYGYPSIEDILLLKVSKIIGYKVVYDIVENITFSDHKKSSLRMKLKNYSSRKMLNQIYKNGSICFAISSDLVGFCKKICQGKVPVIHLPISVNVDFVSSFKEENEFQEGHVQRNVKVFYGGSFGYKDGLDYLIKGFSLACQKVNNIELILTGKISKQTDGTIQRLISGSQSKDLIHYLGCLSEKEYFQTMANADILCVLRINTRYANAGFPFKLGEYLASGNAVISTDVGDVKRYLENRENAILINPESEFEVCNAILELSTDKALREKIGKAGRKTAAKHFSADNISSILWNNITKLS